ncbi:hypothetical protein KC343_g4864 [Hortaea werneckii]|nr:hypothetical protein KC352_g22152 [Hortaea werneckii]KAI7567643.1 hypothetical protein KC317_g4844 [Hortaea werneckii]KAI7619398.1 hypothetical protein KC346_g4583 [Hortaea werneckii]KAI7630067.1 hypothetical protein KC343_g4864 [Hortaea werneckii]KAI7675899.1 hypothetical protein KC319_g4473 [Hortaea werneckii]
MSYVPPALRNKQAVSQREAQNAGDSLNAGGSHDLVSLEEVRNYFWPLDENGERHTSDTLSRTLHDSSASPGRLAYVFLFNQANPRWESDHIIYTKSNLDLLPAELAGKVQAGPDDAAGVGTSPQPRAGAGDEVDLAENGEAMQKAVLHGSRTKSGASLASNQGEIRKETASAIAIFKQVHCSKEQRAHAFKFEGWFKIERLAFLEPQSPELIRMLQQKWQKTDRFGNIVQKKRDEKGWQESLSQRWAVIKFAENQEAKQERGTPNIERIEEGESHKKPQKTVNEILAEMRLGGGKEEGHGSVESEKGPSAGDTSFLDSLERKS